MATCIVGDVYACGSSSSWTFVFGIHRGRRVLPRRRNRYGVVESVTNAEVDDVYCFCWVDPVFIVRSEISIPSMSNLAVLLQHTFNRGLAGSSSGYYLLGRC